VASKSVATVTSANQTEMINHSGSKYYEDLAEGNENQISNYNIQIQNG